MAAVFFFAGCVGTEFLRREDAKACAMASRVGLANGALAMIMAVWIAEEHTILAALIAILGSAREVRALTVKPAMDRQRFTVPIADGQWLRPVAGKPPTPR